MSTMIDMRMNKPINNPYFITTSSDGYNPGYKGKYFSTKCPDPDCNALPSNLNYAIGRYHEVSREGKDGILLPIEDADKLIQYALDKGLITGLIPQEGAIACWKKGNTSYLAVVEECGELSMTVSHSIQGVSAFDMMQLTKGENNNWNDHTVLEGYSFLTFIYNPMVYAQKPIIKSDEEVAKKKATTKKKKETAKEKLEEVNESEVQSKVDETDEGK